MESLYQRLKERKLVQWALAYLAGAWAFLESVDLVGGQFGWPARLTQSLFVLAAIGFLVTLVLAWYHGEKGRQRVSGMELLLLAAAFAFGATMLTSIEQGEGAVEEDAVPEARDNS